MTATTRTGQAGPLIQVGYRLPPELVQWLRTYAAKRSMSVNLAVADAIRQMQATTSEKE